MYLLVNFFFEINSSIQSQYLQDCDITNFHTHTRTRTILRHPSSSTEGSISCPPLLQVEPCNTGDSCTVYRWNVTEWGACTLQPRAVCGTGKKIRVLQCLQDNSVEVEKSICDKVKLPLLFIFLTQVFALAFHSTSQF